MPSPQNPAQEPDLNQCKGYYEFSNFLSLRETTEEKVLLEAVIISHTGPIIQAKMLKILRQKLLPVLHTLSGHSFKRSCSCTLQACAHAFMITDMTTAKVLKIPALTFNNKVGAPRLCSPHSQSADTDFIIKLRYKDWQLSKIHHVHTLPR